MLPSPDDVIANKTNCEAFDNLIDLIYKALKTKERSDTTIFVAWKLIVDRQLWSSRYQSLEQLQYICDFGNAIQPSITAHSQFERRIKTLRSKILLHWPGFKDTSFSNEIQGASSLRSLEQLSAMIGEKEGLDFLRAAISARYRRRRTKPCRQTGRLYLQDIHSVLADCLKRKEFADRLGRVRQSTRAPESLNYVDSGPQPASTASGFPPPRILPVVAASSRPHATLVSPALRKSTRLRQRQCLQASATSPLNGPSDNPDVGGAVVSHAVQQAASLPDGDGTVVPHVVQQAVSSPHAHLAESSRTQVALSGFTTTDCDYCGPARQPRPQPAKHHTPDLKPLTRVHLRFSALCHKHLRVVAASAGLQNNVRGSLLIHRMQEVYRHSQQLECIQQEHPAWFRRCARARNTADGLGPYKYQAHASALEKFRINDSTAKALFNRYAGSPDAWDRFQRDGTINIDNFFAYLTSHPVFRLVEEEYNIYKHHRRNEINGKHHRGWSRHMFYSLVQQLIRQDPGYWAIVAVARPDRNWRLISYPYYTKDAEKDDKTGFAHWDVNVEQLVETGRGESMVQGSVSLDDEEQDGCTVLVPGFQRHLHAWWAGHKKRSLIRERRRQEEGDGEDSGDRGEDNDAEEEEEPEGDEEDDDWEEKEDTDWEEEEEVKSGPSRTVRDINNERGDGRSRRRQDKYRNRVRGGLTTNASQIYTPDDERRFGRLTPVPCKRGAIRITLPSIVHGSTTRTPRRRRTVFVWHSGIRPDHETLDLEESETYDEIAMCHLTMKAPFKSTSGECFRYGRPPFRFPGTCKLGSTSMVGDAMIGGRRWDDPQVIEERDILLGPDSDKALQLVHRIRERLIEQYQLVFPYVQELERRAYGPDSFYASRPDLALSDAEFLR